MLQPPRKALLSSGQCPEEEVISPYQPLWWVLIRTAPRHIHTWLLGVVGGRGPLSVSAFSSLLVQKGPLHKAPGRCILSLIQCIPSASQPGSASDVREEVQRADLPKITTSKEQGQERDPVLVLSLNPPPSAELAFLSTHHVPGTGSTAFRLRSYLILTPVLANALS